MSKDKLSDYDGTTAGNNTDIGGISIAEGMLPSAVNNSMRELTRQLGAFANGTEAVAQINFGDNAKAVFGAGSDLQIYHDGSHSYISDQGTGQLRFLAENFQVRNAGNSSTMIYATPGGSVQLYHNNATKLETTSSGIDVTGTALAHTVEIGNGSAGGTSEVVFSDNVSGRAKILYDHGASPNEEMGFEIAGTRYMTIENGGNIGIGTAAPSGVLHTSVSSGANKLIVQNTAASQQSALQLNTDSTTPGQCQIYMGKTSAPTNGQVGYDPNSDFMYFYTNNSEKVRITSGGNVGIGESNPSLGSSANGLHITGASGNDGVLKLDSSDTTHSGKIQFTENGTDQWRIAYDPTNNHLEFTESGVADRMVITDGGNVGIGKSSSITDKLHIENTGANCLLSVARTDGAAGRLVMQHTSSVGALQTTGSVPLTFGTADTERLRIASDGKVCIGGTSPSQKFVVTNAGADNIIMAENSSASIQMFMQAGGSGGTVGTLTNHQIQLLTNNTARMTIGDSGVVYIGGSTTRAKVNVERNDASSYNYASISVSNQPDHFVFYNDSTVTGSITRSGGTGVNYNTSSDYRLKEAVVDMTGAIDRVKALAPKRFNFIADADTTVDGFLAHEAQAVVPEAVTGTHNEVDDDGNAVMQGIDQSKLVPLLTGALQEAIAKIEDLETRLAALEGA